MFEILKNTVNTSETLNCRRQRDSLEIARILSAIGDSHVYYAVLSSKLARRALGSVELVIQCEMRCI